MSYYQSNAIVTICSDQAGEHPLRIGKVKRISVDGTWRLAGSSEWYRDDGTEFPSPVTFARHYRDGDEAAIEVEKVERINEKISDD